MELAKKKRHSAVRPRSGPPEVTLTGTPKQLAVLDLLQDFDCLPSTYIKAWLGSPKYIDDLLTLLDAGHYICMPFEAKIANVHYRPFVYKLAPRGEALLVDRNRWRPRDKQSDHFKHQFLRSIAKFSFWIAPREISGLRLLTQADILANPRCPATTRADRHASDVPLRNRILKPDEDLFGYEYTSPTGSKAYMFFQGYEVDRGTEQKKYSAVRKTRIGMLSGYREYFVERIFASRYGLAQASVPILTTNRTVMRDMMETVRADWPQDAQPRLMFKAIPDFEEKFPPPTGHMVTEPWARVGADPLHIIETLKVTAERKTHDTRAENRTR